MLEWVAFSFSRGSSQPRDLTQVSHIAGGFFTTWAIRELKTLSREITSTPNEDRAEKWNRHYYATKSNMEQSNPRVLVKRETIIDYFLKYFS